MKTTKSSLYILAVGLIGVAIFFWYVAGQQIVDISPSSTKTGTIYLVKAGDGTAVNGATLGCGDTLAAYSVTYNATQGKTHGLLNALLGNHSQTVGPNKLQNAVWQSDLKIDTISTANGKTTVALTGTVKLGGVCDGPRFVQQIKNTVDQAAGKTVDITINGKTLSSYQSSKG